MTKKPQAYPLRYVEDFFGVSNEVASSAEALSEGGSQTIGMRNRKSIFTTLLAPNLPLIFKSIIFRALQPYSF
jgi:hypothetical protein